MAWLLVTGRWLLVMGQEMTLNMRDVLVRKMQKADLPFVLQLLSDDELGQSREALQKSPHDDLSLIHI